MDSFPADLLDELARVYASAAIDAYFLSIEASIHKRCVDQKRAQDTEKFTLSATDEGAVTKLTSFKHPA